MHRGLLAVYRPWIYLFGIYLLATPAFVFGQQELVINEILYAPANAQNEFVELLNLSGNLIDLCEFTLSDNRDDPSPLCDETHPTFVVQPDDYILLSRDSLALREAFPDLQARVLYPPDWPALNNGGDAVKIRRGEVVIDVVAYSTDWGGNRVSLERRDPAGPSQAAFNWGSSVDEAGATPGRKNSIYAPDVSPPKLLLAEVSYAEVAYAATVSLFWQEDLNTNRLSITQFLVDEQHPISLSIVTSTHITLHFDIPITGIEITIEGISDLTGNPLPVTQHPLAKLPTAQSLQINEIMYAPRAVPDDHLANQPEYIELINTSADLLSLRHLTLAGAPDEFNEADTLYHDANFPVVPPGAWVLFFAVPGEPAAGLTMLQEAFPELDTTQANLTLLPVSRSSLDLLNGGDQITIAGRNGLLIDQVVYDDDWHHPMLLESTGISLERRSLQAPGQQADNWGSSVAPAGGTPGAVNSLVAHPTPPDGVKEGLILTSDLFSPDADGLDDVLQIRYSTKDVSQVLRLQVYNLDGRLVRTLADAHIGGANSYFFWDGLDDEGHLLPAGVYILSLHALDTGAGKSFSFKKPVILARRL